MSITSFFQDSDSIRKEKLSKRKNFESKVESLTVKYLRGEASTEYYQKETNDFDYRLDLRQVASKLDN